MSATISVGALWGDVFVAEVGVIGCAYDRHHSVVIEFYRMVEEDQVIRTYEDIVIQFDEQVLHVRADSDGHNIRVMGQGAETGQFKVNGEGHPQLLTYGTHSCDLDRSLHYIVQVSTTEYYNSRTGTFHPIPQEILGTSNGFIQLLNEQPVWADLARAFVPQMLYPFDVPGVFIGEGAADPAHIQALEDNVQKNIYNGYAARPRAVWDSNSNTLAVAARSENGVNFHFFRRPLKDLSVVVPPIEPPVEPPIPPVEPPVEPPDPEEPMACTPVVPPQDVVAASLNDLRQFCQTYCFPGPNDHPYAADEIHENGLFIADGLIYFMMSDTGLWAKILMNPDDKRGWNEKRASADAALQDYMRRRVGDVPASSAPGGTMTGDVNVG